MYFYSWGDAAKSQNREVQTHEKSGMTVWVYA